MSDLEGKARRVGASERGEANEFQSKPNAKFGFQPKSVVAFFPLSRVALAKADSSFLIPPSAFLIFPFRRNDRRQHAADSFSHLFSRNER
jgi:hypothetical protein